MSVARKDWSALSSLARQWSLEDEEEQQRERRRRTRALSAKSEEASPQHTPNGEQPATERLRSPEEEAAAPRPPDPDPQDEGQDVQALLRKRRQRRQAGTPGDPIQEQPETEEPPRAPPPPSAPQDEAELQPPERLNPTRRSPSAREESREVGKPGGERKGVSDKTPLTPETPDSEKPVSEKALAKRLTPEETLPSREPLERTSEGKTEAAAPKLGLERKPSVRERCSAFERMPATKETGTSSEKSSVLERSSSFKKVPGSEKSLILERSSAFEKLPGPGEKSSVLERSSSFKKVPGSEKSLILERSSAFEKPPGPGEKSSVLERSSSFKKVPGSEKSLVLERSSAFEKPPGPGEKSSVLERSSSFKKPPGSGEKSSVLERSSSFKKVPGSEETSLILERSSAFEKPSAPREKSSVLERSSAFEKPSAPREKSSVPEKSGPFEQPLAAGRPAGTDRRLVSEKAQMFEKPQGSEKVSQEPGLAPRRTGFERLQAREQPAPGGNPSPPGEQGARTLPDKRPSSSATPGEQGAASQQAPATRFPPVSFQVKIPSGEDKADMPSPTQATPSTPVKRSGYSTISFQMSPRKENTESRLFRSASVKIGGSTGSGEKMQEKVQKYHLAIQRSNSVKSPGASRTEIPVTSTSAANVANKRQLFEKELQSGSRADRVSRPRDNLKLQGAVTSKLSLFISKSQASPEQDPQEAQEDTAATRWTQEERRIERLDEVV